MSQVEVRGIGKKFGDVIALHEVDLVIQDGEFFTLLGPSGSGKSTLLRILAGLEAPTSGKLFFDGEDVTKVPPWKRQIAMVFQNYALYPHMTVSQNIGYPLRIAKFSADDIKRRVAEVAEALQIGALLQRKPSQLSGGQQQRVALARALARKPRLFLFDEPLSNLDARMRIEARAFLKTLTRDLGVTSVYVTHDQTEAMAMSDRMAVLEKGRLCQVGKPREVYRTPATPFVATFVGNPPMNLLNVELSSGKDHRRVMLGDNSLPAPLTELPNGRALLGVRPEEVLWRGHDPYDALPARVVFSEDMGNEVLMTLEVHGQRLVMRQPGFTLEEDALGFVYFDSTRCMLYPVEEP